MIHIKHSSASDLDEVLRWLKEDYDKEGSGTGFWCNRDSIRKAHEEGYMWVGCEPESSEAVAFRVDGLAGPDILAVRPDKRRLGYARKLVEHCVQTAQAEDLCVLQILCAPHTSVPFWKRMGIQLLSEAFADCCPDVTENYAFRVLEKSHDLSQRNGDPVEIEINFRSEGGFELSQFQGTGSRQKDGQILLPERVVSYCPRQVFTLGDTFVDIAVDGQSIYDGKAKYPGAKAIGVSKVNGEVFYIDQVLIPSLTVGGSLV